jgi:hypothetical protein
MVASRVKRAAPVILLTPAGCGNEGDAATPRRRPDLRGQLVSIEIRESDIQQKRMRTKGLGEFECAPAGVCCLDGVRLHSVLPGSGHESAGFAGKNVHGLGEIPCAGLCRNQA